MVLVIPGQLVLPITVTVLGWLSPNFTANLPVSQSQFGSLGQQYQSCSVLHFARGMEVFASVELRQRYEGRFEEACTDSEQNTSPDTADYPMSDLYMCLCSSNHCPLD